MAGTDPKPLVSILVPAYNAERWIRQSLDSALEQTYPATEIIVVDDGSTDSTAEVIRRYEGRVRLVAGKHAGGNAARNQLAGLARGEWLQFLDADDYLLPDKIADQMRLVSQNPDVDVVYCPVLLLDELKGTQHILPIEPGDDFTLHFIRWGHLNTNAFLFRREALMEVGSWNPEQAACQEHELLYRLVCADKKFALVNHPGAVYRFHSAPSVSRKDPLRTLRLKLELLDKMESYLERSRRMTSQHRKELFAGRLEGARSAWKIDPVWARTLAKRARTAGTWWVSFSPALPASFQFALRFLGYAGAERLAGMARRTRQAQG